MIIVEGLFNVHFLIKIKTFHHIMFAALNSVSNKKKTTIKHKFCFLFQQFYLKIKNKKENTKCKFYFICQVLQIFIAGFHHIILSLT